jgi:hypothetical protein
MTAPGYVFVFRQHRQYIVIIMQIRIASPITEPTTMATIIPVLNAWLAVSSTPDADILLQQKTKEIMLSKWCRKSKLNLSEKQ